MPAIAVTPDGTHLFVTWYDRRNSGAGNGNIDRFGTIGSISGSGTAQTVTFTANFQINDVSFPEVFGLDPAVVSNYRGDYDMASATNTNFYTTWGDNRLSSTAPDVRFAAVPVGTTRPFGLIVHAAPDRDADGAAATLQAAPPSFADLGRFIVPPPAGGTASTGSVDTHSGSTGLHGTVVDQVFASTKGTPAPTPIGLSGGGHGGSSDGAQADVPVWRAPTL
jgi:hypothetical protein